MSNNLYEKIAKVLIYFWGVVLVLYGIKVVISSLDTFSNTPQNSISNIVKKVKHYFESNSMEEEFPIVQIKGARFAGLKGCGVDYRSPDPDHNMDPAVSNISSYCSDGECEMKVVFRDKVPQSIQVKAQEGENGICKTRLLDIENPEVVGYRLHFILTEALREKLGIPMIAENIKMKHARGYAISFINGLKEMTFDYSEPLNEDVIMADGKIVATIKFRLK